MSGFYFWQVASFSKVYATAIYQCKMTLAHVMPAPNPDSNIRSPLVSLFSSAAIERAMGMDAAVVLPVWVIVTAVLDIGISILEATASIIRMLA